MPNCAAAAAQSNHDNGDMQRCAKQHRLEQNKQVSIQNEEFIQCLVIAFKMIRLPVIKAIRLAAQKHNNKIPFEKLEIKVHMGGIRKHRSIISTIEKLKPHIRCDRVTSHAPRSLHSCRRRHPPAAVRSPRDPGERPKSALSNRSAYVCQIVPPPPPNQITTIAMKNDAQNDTH
jgi:hypothetical protein